MIAGCCFFVKGGDNYNIFCSQCKTQALSTFPSNNEHFKIFIHSAPAQLISKIKDKMTTSFAYDDQVIFAITCKICHTTIFTSLPSNNELSIRIYNVRANNLVTRQHVKLFTKAIRYDSPLLEDIIDHQDAELQEIFDLQTGWSKFMR